MNIMKKVIACVMGLPLGLISCMTPSDDAVRKVLLDEDWRFSQEAASEAFSEDFDDADWRTVSLPHDWSIESLSAQDSSTIGPFSKKSIGKGAVGHTVGGTGWYRKSFKIEKSDAGKIHRLYFEGSYGQTEVWVNGQKTAENKYGYSSFWCDVTPYCHPAGEVNQIAVKVQNEGKNSRWYSGSGIYRHVWLMKIHPLHLDEWETCTQTLNLIDGHADMKISTFISNEQSVQATTDCHFTIRSPQGDVVAEKYVSVEIPQNGKKEVDVTFALDDVQAWSVETPQLYTAHIELLQSRNLFDAIDLPFGIRTISFSAEEGFKLNNRVVKLKGACVHHDNGLLGAASIDRAEERKVELLKMNGFNAVRCAHNPPAESFLRACDEQGMLVIDEAFDQWQRPKNPQDYHAYFNEWHEKDLSSMIKRDRNHPSIIMWSIGNEIADRSDDQGVEIARRLRDIVKTIDNTRPITAAINDYWDNPSMNWERDSDKAMLSLDVAGYNYMWWKYASDHRKFPQRIMYGSETVAQDAATCWSLVEQMPCLIGDFVWTGIDYLGEAGIGHTLELKADEPNPQFMGWPWFGAWCGDIDICGDKKPQSYYRDVVWRQREITMAVQPKSQVGKVEKVSYWGWKDEYRHWNWDKEDTPMIVHVYSRAPKARLYLNGRLMGEQTVSEKDLTATFQINYEPGVLKAVAVYDGGESSAATLCTTGRPVALRLVADRLSLKPTKNDLSYVTVELIDADGNVVLHDDRTVNLSVQGKGIIKASGNANPTDMQSFLSLQPQTYLGKAMAIVQPLGVEGDITITVTAEGLEGATLTLPVQKAAPLSDDSQIENGKVWKDVEGNMINAHGGGILYHEGTYYWYGEQKGDSTYRLDWVTTWECWRADAGGVSCYSSKDLVHWKYEGKALPTVDDSASDLHPSQVIERPKVIYNNKTRKFVMWMHIESPDYEKAHVGVAVSDTPQGPYTYLESFKPNGEDSRDQTIFKDDDGTAYHICSSEWNSTLYISRLTDDYTRPSGDYVRRFIGQSREAPAVFKRGGRYYMLSSGCTGWDPNFAHWAVADSIMGVWDMHMNPCKGKDADKTFYAQSTFVLPIEGKKDCYIAMFDRWNKTDLIDSRYIWLPVEFIGDRPVIRWQETWSPTK